MIHDGRSEGLPAPAIASHVDAQDSTLEPIDDALRLALDAPLRRGAPRGALAAIASGFLARREVRWIHVDLKRLVNDHIPVEL